MIAQVPVHCFSITSIKTEPAVFIFWMLYFQRIPLSDNLEITTVISVVVSCGGPKKFPVHRFGVVIFTFSVGLTTFFESRVVFNPGLGGVRGVVSAIISHEQTHLGFQLFQFLVIAYLLLSIKTESAVFIFWMLYFQRTTLSD